MNEPITEELLQELGFTMCGPTGEKSWVYDYDAYDDASPRIDFVSGKPILECRADWWQSLKGYSSTIVTLRIVVNAIIDYEKTRTAKGIYKDIEKRFTRFLLGIN